MRVTDVVAHRRRVGSAGELDLSSLRTDRFSLDSVGAAFARAGERSSSAVRAVVFPDDEGRSR